MPLDTRTPRRSDHLLDLTVLIVAGLALAVAFGCGRERPAIEARAQTITFAPAPVPAVNQATATVSAKSSSGLPVRFASATAAVCAVDRASGLVTAAASGTCTIVATQPGDTRYAPAPQTAQDVAFRFMDTLTLGALDGLSVHDLATVEAVASTGATVSFTSATPATCAVDAASGLLSTTGAGDCTVVAAAGGLQASRTFSVAAPVDDAAPGAPEGVTASLGEAPGTVRIRAGSVRAGGHPITGFRVASSPAGATASSATQPVVVACPSSCAGYRFTIAADSERGAGLPSAQAAVVTRFSVVATFHEPDTQPNESIFVGTFTYDSSAGTVSGLAGRLSESMTGGATPYPNDTMTWVTISHQLSSIPVTLDGVGGWLVTAFALDSTDTFTGDPRFGGTDGWSPGSGNALYSGFPGANPGNAYVRLFVNAADPTAPPTRTQLDKLAYADCAPGGMMGATCMTGTTVAGYGTVGSMGGYPADQVVTVK